jgi:CheY-like chemotaxis protein
MPESRVRSQRSTAAPVRRNVLLVNVDEHLFEKVAPLLARSEFEIDRFPGARTALELVSVVSFDVLVALFPLPDIPAQDFLDSVRAPESPCRRSPLLVLSARERLADAERYLGRGVNRVVALEETAEQLQREVSMLLSVAPRRSLRLMVRVNVLAGERPDLSLFQSENLSHTGMLLRGGEPYPLGTRIAFEFHLGTDRSPVRGEAEVVRHTTPGREEVRGGMGVRFFYFEKDGLVRLQRFLTTLGR